ncbi:MAG: FkbM family methyltransferase [Alphaproteobacteria bacterium]
MLGSTKQINAQLEAAYRASQKSPKDPIPLQTLASLYTKLGNTNTASKFYAKALRLDPKSIPLLNDMIRLLMRGGRVREALPYLTQICTLLPEDSGEFQIMRRYRNYVDFLRQGKEIATFTQQNEKIAFFVSEDNATLEAFYVDGRFFETRELTFTQSILPKNPVILDIGANTGNHSVFYAKFCGAKKIYPFEPHPTSISLFRRNIDLNKITCVDPSFLGLAVGEKQSKLRFENHMTGNLGLASFTPDPKGNLPVCCLDDVIDFKVDFIKIDIEGMELEVLRGARKTIAKYKPQMMLEIKHNHDAAFLKIMDEMGYQIIHQIKDLDYMNYFVKAT